MKEILENIDAAVKSGLQKAAARAAESEERNVTLDRLRSRAAAEITGAALASIEELNEIKRDFDAAHRYIADLEASLRLARNIAGDVLVKGGET